MRKFKKLGLLTAMIMPCTGNRWAPMSSHGPQFRFPLPKRSRCWRGYCDSLEPILDDRKSLFNLDIDGLACHIHYKPV